MILILSYCIIPSIFYQSGVSALHLAAAQGNLDLISTLLEGGADVNLGSYKKETSLMFAIISHQMAAAEKLIEAGADVSFIFIYSAESFHFYTDIVARYCSYRYFNLSHFISQQICYQRMDSLWCFLGLVV